jgi:hypothetical protein
MAVAVVAAVLVAVAVVVAAAAIKPLPPKIQSLPLLSDAL